MKSTATRTKSFSYVIGSILLLICISSILPVYAAEESSDNTSAKPETITFIVGESTIVRSPWPTVRVAVTDPTIADVQVLTPDQLLLQGNKVGSTDLIIWSEDETKVKQWKVQVKLDTARFQKKLLELFPDASLEVSESGSTLLVTGLLRSAEQAKQLHDFLDKSGITYVDMTSVAGVQQVLLEVRVAEVSRGAVRALGINAFHTDDDFFVGDNIGTIAPVSIGPSGGQAGDNTSFVFTDDVTVGPLVTIFGGFPRADFEIFLRALAENQYLKLLANPTLVALSGEEASFLAGGEFPIPVTQSAGGGGGGNAISIQYREYGVRVSFRPVVLGDGTINLHVAPEVSELSAVGAVIIQGSTIPTLVTRKAETTLELESGQTFAMAGLIYNKVEAINSRIPGLGDLPILGPLFRSVRYQKNETELVVLVTTSLVEPMSLATAPPLPGLLHEDPNDWELYIEGRIAGKKPAKIDSDDAKWLKQMGLDQLVGPGAWDSYDKPVSSSQAGTASKPDTEGTDTQSSQKNEKTTDSNPADVTKSSVEEKEMEK